MNVPVYVINLDSRPDRWRTISEICRTCDIEPIRVSAVKASPGWHGCARSHQKVQELAERAGHQWYVVLEDDATFTLDAWNTFKGMLPTLWKRRATWDIFNGGCGFPEYFKMMSLSPILYQVKAPCTQFLLVNSSAYPTIKGWTTSEEAIDHYLTNKCRMIGTYPFIAHQDTSSSDIGIGDPNDTIAKGEATIRGKILWNILIWIIVIITIVVSVIWIFVRSMPRTLLKVPLIR